MNSNSNQIKKFTFAGAIVALGIIFGDIGTSPLYVFRAVLACAIVHCLDGNFANYS